LGLEGQEFSFTAGDLAAWKNEIDLSLRQPLVVINACQTAAFLPEHYESLPKGFADRGASGVIGTQVKVHELFASHFIQLFFQRFLAQQSVGRSLFEARRELLFNYVEGEGGREYRPDPRGLVYSLFAAADVKLAQPVIGQKRSVQGGDP
jgi:CHAT domain-containing protein